jgi:hypothetical protein
VQARVVVGELVQVRQGDLPGQDRIVAGDVRSRVNLAVFSLDVDALVELGEVKWRGREVDL